MTRLIMCWDVSAWRTLFSFDGRHPVNVALNLANGGSNYDSWSITIGHRHFQSFYPQVIPYADLDSRSGISYAYPRIIGRPLPDRIIYVHDAAQRVKNNWISEEHDWVRKQGWLFSTLQWTLELLKPYEFVFHVFFCRILFKGKLRQSEELLGK